MFVSKECLHFFVQQFNKFKNNVPSINSARLITFHLVFTGMSARAEVTQTVMSRLQMSPK